MRIWLCLVATACGADSMSAPVPSPPASRPAPRASPAPRTAPHGAEIVAIAATPDGASIATADRLGGIRLWTALDGAHEPVVVPGAAPRALALWRDGDGFALAALDAAGGVELVRTTAAGAVRGRAAVPGGPATELASTPEGLLILRADQAIALVDAAATERARLVPEPGTRVDGLVARAGRVLALIQEDKRLHGRWIVVQLGARWGAATPALPFAIRHAALSPSGDLLAVTRLGRLHPALIDLANGTARNTALCVSRAWPHDADRSLDAGEIARSDSAPVPLGFVTESLIACAVMTQLVWWDTDGNQRTASGGGLAVARAPVAVGDGALIAGSGPNLAIATPDRHHFLGYGVHDLSGLRVDPGGIVVSASADRQALVLDAGLADRARFDRSGWLELAAIDDRYAIASATVRTVERKTGYRVAVIDGVSRTVHQVLPLEASDKALAYAPETRLLAISGEAMALLLRFDPVRHTFGAPIQLGSAIGAGKVYLLDPARAGGVVALEVYAGPDGQMVSELRDRDLAPGATAPYASYRVPGELRAVDRAGRLYVRRADDRTDIAVFARDRVVARLPQIGDMTLRPSPDGSLIAAFQGPRLTLVTAGGQVRWDSAAWSVADAGWTDDGALIVQFPTGVARVDLATGELAERRCGWSFGLSEQALDARFTGPSICEPGR